MRMVSQFNRKIRSLSLAKRATIAYFIANISVKGISVISGPIFTRIMSTEQYGIVSTFQSWQSLLVIVFSLNLAQGVFNNGMLDFKEDRDIYQNSLLLTSSLSTIFYLIIYLLFRNSIYKLTKLGDIYFLIIFTSCLFLPAYHYWNGRQRYEFKYKLTSIISVICALLSVILSIVLVKFGEDELAALHRIIGIEIVNILIGVIFYIYTILKAKFKFKKEYCKYALKFNLPLLPHYISMYILASSDRIMISRMVSQEATAIYSVAYSIYSIIYIFWTSVEAALTPWIYQKLSENKKDEVKRISNSLLLMYGGICIMCVLFAPEIMRVMAPSNYYIGIYVIPSVAAGAFFTAVYSLYIRVEFFYKKTKFSGVATLCAAIINVVFNLVFIKIFGFIAAGYTTLTCYMLLYLLHYINVRHFGYQKCLDNKRIFIISIIMLVTSIGLSFLYSYDVARYTLIIALAFICIWKKEWIYRVVSEFKI